MAANMVQRILVAAVAIPVAVAAAWYGGPVLAGLLALLAAIGAAEIIRLARQGGIMPWRWGAMLSAGFLPVYAWLLVTGRREGSGGLDLAVVWLVVILFHGLLRRPPDKKPLASVAVTVLATLYAGGLLSFAIVIRHAQGYGERSMAGMLLLLFPIVTTWICDTAAMEVGRRLKGPKLAPTISPGKTWSGSIAGFLAAMFAAPLLLTFVLDRWGAAGSLTPWHALMLGAGIGIVGQLGDLTESLFKREAGVKDSGHLLPGHGGILDRLDSLYLVIPLSAVFYRAVGIL